MKCKMLISYHKPDVLLKDEILTPIHAGRALMLKRATKDSEALKWMENNTLGDNTGENISQKNDLYNEMTAVYWAWKNYEDLGNPDYIGFMHYRRHFIFKDLPKSVYMHGDIDESYLKEIGYSELKITSILEKYDFVTSKPHYRDSLYLQYKRNHHIEDLDCAISILKEKYPEYSNSADEYLNGHDAYFCNMFIFPKKIFFDYAKWLFDITFELEKRSDMDGKRLFISEWLTGIYITHLKKKGLKGCFLPTMIAEGEHRIPIALSADNNYVFPLLVTMTSILENSYSCTKIDFYIIFSDNVSLENRLLIKNLEDKYPDTKIVLINNERKFDDAKVTTSHISTASYYRLLLPNLLPDVSKCLYLDCDIIVCGDLTELFRINIDDRYVAGVKAAGYFWPPSHSEKHAGILGIDKIDQYINAGVLLINLKKMRENKLQKEFEYLAKKGFPSEDQDVINVACLNMIRHIDFKFNVMTKYPILDDNAYDNSPMLNICYEKNDWDYGRCNPVIIHYADKKKPWSYFETSYASEWWKYAVKAGLGERLYDQYLEKAIGNAFSLNKLYQDEIKRRKAWERKFNEQKRSFEDMQHSVSFRIGRKITYLPRKIRGGIRCVNEHGLIYTLKYLFHIENH